ncbi:ATP-binding protein [Marinobacter nauticus]|uniref:ATP-binding protein n=1 Tax=Marinobacter nauticus TaxID=2743 RepID=UPI000EAFDD87|nr:ATP-binding protein [Marinobacter nauticus]RKR78920.1 AAA domain-containing protein [Marinobacter nauticus]
MSAASLLEDASGFWIPTPMFESIKHQIDALVSCGHTGMLIIGEARLGKSNAMRALEHALTNRSGQSIRVFYTHYGLRDVGTIRAVFAKTARALGFDVKRQSADTLLDHIVIRLADAAMGNDTRQVALAVDEAQLLTIDQLNAFAEIYNDLVNLHINCSILFIANSDQFHSLANALLRPEKRYLRERFFNNVVRFYGIRSESELKDCLAGYDDYAVSETPRICATEYFCPTLYEQSWRLTDIAPIFWQNYRERYGIPLGQESWGMAQFVRTTHLLLMDYLPHCDDKDDLLTLEACVIKSLEGAGIVSSLVTLVGHND